MTLLDLNYLCAYIRILVFIERVWKKWLNLIQIKSPEVCSLLMDSIIRFFAIEDAAEYEPFKWSGVFWDISISLFLNGLESWLYRSSFSKKKIYWRSSRYLLALLSSYSSLKLISVIFLRLFEFGTLNKLVFRLKYYGCYCPLLGLLIVFSSIVLKRAPELLWIYWPSIWYFKLLFPRDLSFSSFPSLSMILENSP